MVAASSIRLHRRLAVPVLSLLLVLTGAASAQRQTTVEGRWVRLEEGQKGMPPDYVFGAACQSLKNEWQKCQKWRKSK